jgi:hypothetical protein
LHQSVLRNKTSLALITLAVACQGTIGDGGDEADAPQSGAAIFELQAPLLPRLTTVQYGNTLRHLLGDDLPAVGIEADTNPYLFYSIGATTVPLSELGVQQFEEAADAIVSAVFADAARRDALVACTPQAPGDGCAAQFIATFGRRAFRRPLSDAEQARWLAVSNQLSDGDAWLGLRMAVAGMLQSPNLLYRVELGEADPADDSRRRYTDYEMASRLSFLLWNTTPDDELLDAAERGELSDADGIETQARRLLDDPRAGEAIQEFFAQYFDLGRLDGLTRNTDSYPQFTPTLPESMRTEVKLLVDDFVNRRDADIRGIYSTRRTFVNSELASLYGIEADGASEVTYVPVELPEDGPRAGLLSLGALLTMNAHETETSPTLRGKYVRERVLCESVPAPPDDVDIDIPSDPTQTTTLRERLDEHRTNPVCAACHAFIDPPGFLFEHFDSVGAYRTKDNGQPIDASGDLDGAPLSGASDLAKALENDDRVSYCMVTQLFRHAQGRLDEATEGAALRQLDEQFADSGYRFRELMVSLVAHDSFRFVAVPEEETP